MPTPFSSLHVAKPKALLLYLKRLVATMRAPTPPSASAASGFRVSARRQAEPRTEEEKVTFLSDFFNFQTRSLIL